VYFAAKAVFTPGKTSMASMAMLQQSSESLSYSVSSILYTTEWARRQLRDVKRLYEAMDVKPIMKNGKLPYPSPGQADQGMGVELR
jgi:hypothetical protein